MRGQRFYSDNHQEKHLYTGYCNTYYHNGSGFIDGKNKNPFIGLWNWNFSVPEYKVENTEWNVGSGFDNVRYDSFGIKTGGMWDEYKQSEAIFYIKMSLFNKIRRWMNM